MDLVLLMFQVLLMAVVFRGWSTLRGCVHQEGINRSHCRALPWLDLGAALAPAGREWKARLPGKLGFAFPFRPNPPLNLTDLGFLDLVQVSKSFCRGQLFSS